MNRYETEGRFAVDQRVRLVGLPGGITGVVAAMPFEGHYVVDFGPAGVYMNTHDELESAHD